MKKKVLCFLDKPSGRDPEILIPVTYILERYLNCSVEFIFIWDIYAIRRKKPDLILLPNSKGHHMYYEIAKYGYLNKIPVFSCESEGNFRTDGSFDYWGYNTDQFFYQDWVPCWSGRTRDYLRKLIPDQKEKIVLTGGTGFDRYRISDFQSREKILKKYNKEKYKKVIGYAGWAFGKIYSKHKEIALTHIHEDRNVRFQWVESQRKKVRNILEKTITSHPDTLFIFKRHPKESFEDDPYEGPNEMNELLDFENVLYIRQEEKIHDLINISDIWLGFETTTSLEAWLLGKPTILINPDPDFVRNNLHLGSVKVKNVSELAHFIQEFYETGHIKIFFNPELEKNRQNLIADSIGFSDGLNHIRTTYFVDKSLKIKGKSGKARISLRHLRLYYLMHIGKYFFHRKLFLRLPGFKKSVYVFDFMNLPGFRERKDDYYESLDRFHKLNEIDVYLDKKEWDGVINTSELIN